jgi:hypothetical protein
MGQLLSIKAEIFILQAQPPQLPELPLPERIRQFMVEVNLIVFLKSSTSPVTDCGALIMVEQTLMLLEMFVPIKMGMYFLREKQLQIQVFLPRYPINRIYTIATRMHFLQNLIATVSGNGVPIMVGKGLI